VMIARGRYRGFWVLTAPVVEFFSVLVGNGCRCGTRLVAVSAGMDFSDADVLGAMTDHRGDVITNSR
jgi:hypothetical protein